MNRSFAGWLADNPRGAVLVTGLLGLLPLFGVGFAFFLPGAVPALLTLQRGPRAGIAVAMGASVLLALAMWLIGRSVPVGVFYAVWLLGPPLLLASLLGSSRSLSLCIQVATLAAAILVVILHGTFGEPARFWEPFVRQLADEMQRHNLPMAVDTDTFVDAFAKTLWGWVAVLALLVAMCALLLARWWQSLNTQAGSFGAEFREIRLGRVLGVVAAVTIALSLWLDRSWIDDIARVFEGAFLLVGLAAVHRMRAERNLNNALLWATYIGLVIVAPLVVPALAGWGFVDNWLRSVRRPAAA